jgi:hypothetical protein
MRANTTGKARLVAVLLFVGAFTPSLATRAEATAMLSITATGASPATITVADTDGDGVITFLDYSLGDFVFSVDVGITKPTLGSAEDPEMFLFVSAAAKRTTSVPVPTLQVTFSEDGFIGTGDGSLTLASTVLSGGTATYAAMAGSTSIGSVLTLASPLEIVTADGQVSPPSTPYSLTQVVTLSLNPRGSAAVTAGLSVRGIQTTSFSVPEADTLTLFVASLVLLGMTMFVFYKPQSRLA